MTGRYLSAFVAKLDSSKGMDRSTIRFRLLIAIGELFCGEVQFPSLLPDAMTFKEEQFVFAQTLASVLRILLVALFGLAGIAKLFQQRETRDALSDFGVPAQAVPVGSIALPLWEIATAYGLLARKLRIPSLFSSIMLSCSFIVGIVWNLAKGKRPDCHCFGTLYSDQIGKGAILRNVIIIIMSLYIMSSQVNGTDHETTLA